MVSDIRRGGIRWALRIRVLDVPAVVVACNGPGPPGRSAGVHTRRSGDTWRTRTPSSVGGGYGRSARAVLSLSCPASQVPRRCYSVRDGGAVTRVSGWDPDHIYCESGSLTRPFFEPWWSGWLLMPSYGERLGGGAVCPLCRGVASSEAEIGYLLEGRSATLERGGDWLPARG